eukprot:gene12911-14242_t
MSSSERSSKTSSAKSKKANQLLSKEEEFLRINAELEQKTASLIDEAETVLRGQDKNLSGSTSNYTYNESEVSMPQEKSSISDSRTQTKQPNVPRPKSGQVKKKIPTSARGMSAPASNYKSKKATPSGSRPVSQAAKTSNQSPSLSQLNSSDFTVDVFQERVNFANTISTLEQEMADENYMPSKLNDDVLPEVANEMNPEAVVRFLKAKLRVMQEEMDRVSGENNELTSTIKKAESQIKELSDQQQQLQKNKSSLQTQVDKWKKMYEEAKQKNSESDQQIAQFKKEIDAFKREKRQNSANTNALEVRLNRALEETEKNRSALQKARESSKDVSDQERKRIDQIVAENKKLERQKNELMNAFKKQMKLIDILKRQKMHIEAAKMLQFTEEEFVKALDWGS